MDFNIPPLQQSVSNPVILGPKKFSVNKLGLVQSDKIGITDDYVSERSTELNAEQSYIEKVHSKSFTEENHLAESMFSSSQDRCRLKKVGSCFMVLKKENVAPSQNGIFLFGSRHTLPGAVELDELIHEPLHRKQTFAHNSMNRFWNVKLQLSSARKNKSFVEYCVHFLLQIRKFITKLQQAIASELEYIRKLNIKAKSNLYSKNGSGNFGSSDSLYGSNSSGVFIAEDNDNCIHPPKLGKVYAELQIHFKAWDDIMQKYENCRQETSLQSLHRLSMFQRRIRINGTEMLSLTQKLIESRLHSLACCASVHSKMNENGHECNAAFASSDLKRFCKLIEVYNKLVNKWSQKDNPLNGQSFVRSSSALRSSNLENFSSVKLRAMNVLHKNPAKPHSFTVARLLSCLAQPAKSELAFSLLYILELMQRCRLGPYKEFIDELQVSSLDHVDWGNADDIEFDEDQVITSIAGFPVNNISETQLSDASLSEIKQMLFAQGSFIVTFMNYLASNTSLLRGKMRSKSPRSFTSSQNCPDDMSASSDDEASSVASSSFFSQLSGTGGLNSSRKRKTVLWRDSWDQEAVKSLSKSYMACLVTEGPVESLLMMAVMPDVYSTTQPNSYHDDDSGANDQMLTGSIGQRSLVCFRPRYWLSAQSLTLNACITNMITLEVLPSDILASMQEATKAFVIEKALNCWDENICEALGVSAKDKCGSLPVDGLASLSKTAWTFIKALHSLMFIMDRYNKQDKVAQETLPRLEATLDAFYRWCHSKIQQFLSSWTLRPLMQISLGDLSQVTALSLDCLPLVERCHNYVESRRMENPAALHMATKNLRNIDAIITDMQSLSGDCMKMYIKKCTCLANVIIESSFPSQKLWRQNNLTDHSSASSYMENAVKSMLVPIASAVSVLDARSQLATIPPAISAILDSVIRLIFRRSVHFSVQGAMQLQRDFEHIIDYVCSENAALCSNVTGAAPGLSSVRRALWVARTLQRTDTPSDVKSKLGYEETRRRNRGRTWSPVNEGYGDVFDENDWMLKEKELLALRIQHKGSKRRAKRWFSIPCAEDALE